MCRKVNEWLETLCCSQQSVIYSTVAICSKGRILASFAEVIHCESK